jgi:subtilisin
MRRFVSACVVLVVVIIMFTAGTGASAVSGAASTATKEYIVVLKGGVSPSGDADRADAIRAAKAAGGEVLMEYQHALNGFAVRLPTTAVAGVARNPRVLFVAENSIFTAQGTCPLARGGAKGGVLSTQSEFPEQCIPQGIDRVGGDVSGARSGDGRGAIPVNVAVIDTGIDARHPDLTVAGGTDCVGQADRHYHGTHVGGTIAAADNGFGVVGIAPGASLWDVRVLNKSGSGTTAQIICGIDFVTGTRLDTDPTNDIAVANMSLGGKHNNADDENCGRSNSDPMHLAICNSAAAGVTYVVSAGNAGEDIKNYHPAAYQEVLTVSAMADFDGKPGGLGSHGTCPVPESDDVVAHFSNFATLAADRAHTLAAPGVCVISTITVDFFLPESGTDYAIAQGTSMSAPHVAATVALCIGGPCAGLSPGQIVQKIMADAANYNLASKNSGYGYQGDPLRPDPSGKYYGYLIHAGLY